MQQTTYKLTVCAHEVFYVCMLCGRNVYRFSNRWKITVIFFFLQATSRVFFTFTLLLIQIQCILSKDPKRIFAIGFKMRINIGQWYNIRWNAKWFWVCKYPFYIFANLMNKKERNQPLFFFIFSLSLLFQMAYFHTLSFAIWMLWQKERDATVKRIHFEMIVFCWAYAFIWIFGCIFNYYTCLWKRMLWENGEDVY